QSTVLTGRCDRFGKPRKSNTAIVAVRSSGHLAHMACRREACATNQARCPSYVARRAEHTERSFTQMSCSYHESRNVEKMKPTQNRAAATFRSLHESGCFVLPNPWDIGTAIYLERLGFKALATTSAGFAFSLGKSDGAVPRDEMLAHIREIVEATALPVNADFMAGYADAPEEVATNVHLCVENGVAGLSIEDNTGCTDSPLYEKQLAIQRIRAARTAIDASKTGVMLTGRCE